MDRHSGPNRARGDARLYRLRCRQGARIAAMSIRAHRKAAPVSFEPQFGKGGALRQPVGQSGRVHVDRWLPFLILQRSSSPQSSLARRIAIDSPSYLIWSTEDDLAALSAIEQVAACLVEQSGRLLIV